MIDTSHLIVEVAELVVDTQKDLIDIEQVPGQFRKKAESINRCLQFIRTSEKRLYALQQKLHEDLKSRDEYSFIKPHPPDLNLLNAELLSIAKKAAPGLYQQLVEPEVIKEKQKTKKTISEKKSQGEMVPPGSVIYWIPRIVDAVIFLHAPFEIFPFLNSVREMVCLVDTEERKLYLLNYMERWIYKFVDFLNSYASGLASEALLTVSFIGKHQHYPIVLEVIKFLHQEEHWDGPSSQIQRYNAVRLFLLFKKVLYLHLKRKQAIPPTFHAILSEFTHPFIAEEIDFGNDPLMIVTLGFYGEPQRFQFLANLKKKRLQEFVGLYQQLLILVDPNSKHSHALKSKYLDILKTISKIIKKSHMLTDPKIPQTVRSILRRELSRQILAEESFRTSRTKPNQPSPKKLSAAQKLAQLQKKARATAPESEELEVQPLSMAGTPPSPSPSEPQTPPPVSPPPPPGDIVVYCNKPMLRQYEEPQDFSFPLVPEQVSSLAGWMYTGTAIFHSPDTLFYLLSSFKARGNLKFTEMLELARLPFKFEYFTRTKERHIRFVNFAHLIAMDSTSDDIAIFLRDIQNSSQISAEEVETLKEIFPQLQNDNNLGALKELCINNQNITVDGVIKTKTFYEKYDAVSEKIYEQYPYFQQVIIYWTFLDHLLGILAKKIDRDNCKDDYKNLTAKQLEKYLSKQQPNLFKHVNKELKTFSNTFLPEYLGPKLGNLLEYKITPDLMDLCGTQVVILP